MNRRKETIPHPFVDLLEMHFASPHGPQNLVDGAKFAFCSNLVWQLASQASCEADPEASIHHGSCVVGTLVVRPKELCSVSVVHPLQCLHAPRLHAKLAGFLHHLVDATMEQVEVAGQHRARIVAFSSLRVSSASSKPPIASSSDSLFV